MADERNPSDEPTAGHPSRRPIRLRHLVATAAATAVLASGVGAFAADAFSDVPSDHAFHDEIGWMADTGISEGYADGTYRPTAPVSRQAMSAFMQRLYDVQAGTTRTAAQTTGINPGTLWTPLPGMSTNVTIPPGTTGRVVVNTSMETACSGGESGTQVLPGPIVRPVYPVCQARVSLNSAPMSPIATTIDSSDGGVETSGSGESHGMVRVSAVLPAGTHLVSVEVRALPTPAATTGYEAPGFRIENGVLSAHVAFEDA